MQLGQLNVTIKGLFLALGVAGLVSCGSGDSAGGGGAGGGADDTGLFLFVEDILVSDVEEGPDIDVIQVICSAGPPVIAEDFVIARAAITFGVSEVGPVPTSGINVIITGYQLIFTPIAAPVAGIPIPTVVNTTFTMSIDINGTATGIVELFNFQQKALVAAGGTIEAKYNATYVFSAEDDFGESLSVTASTEFATANFNHC